ADRETAAFSSSRGDKALAAQKFEEAEALYRKALDEDGTYLPARYGVAQALLGSNRSGPAVEELRKFVADARACTSLPPEWKTAVAKAEKQLVELDAAGTALQKIQDSYVDGLIDLAQKWTSKDPSAAGRALRRVLALRPGHAKAAELLDKLGRSAGGDVFDLFDGTSLDQWEMSSGLHAANWQVVDGTIVVTTQETAGSYIRSKREFEGDFEVRAE